MSAKFGMYGTLDWPSYTPKLKARPTKIQLIQWVEEMVAVLGPMIFMSTVFKTRKRPNIAAIIRQKEFERFENHFSDLAEDEDSSIDSDHALAGDEFASDGADVKSKSSTRSGSASADFSAAKRGGELLSQLAELEATTTGARSQKSTTREPKVTFTRPRSMPKTEEEDHTDLKSSSKTKKSALTELFKKSVFAYSQSEEYAREVGKRIAHNTAAAEEGYSICCKIATNHIFGTTSAPKLSTGDTNIDKSDLQRLKEYLGGSVYTKLHDDADLPGLLDGLWRLVIHSQAEIIHDELKFFTYQSDFMTKISIDIKGDKRKHLASRLEKVEVLGELYKTHLRQIEGLRGTPVESTTAEEYVDRLLLSNLLTTLKQDPLNLIQFYDKYIHQGQQPPLGGYTELKAELFAWLIRRNMEGSYGFIDSNNGYEPNKQQPTSKHTHKHPHQAAINAVDASSSHNARGNPTTEEKLKWLDALPKAQQLCPWCYCNGKTKNAKGHSIVTCSEAKRNEVVSVKKIIQLLGKPVVDKWRAEADRLRDASESTEATASTTKPGTTHGQSKSKKEKTIQHKQVAVVNLTEVDDEKDHSETSSQSSVDYADISAFSSYQICMAIDGANAVMDPRTKRVHRFSELIMWDNGGNAILARLGTILPLVECTTTQRTVINTALGAQDAVGNAYCPLIQAEVKTHPSAKCLLLLSEGQALMLGWSVEYESTPEGSRNNCPMWIKVTIYINGKKINLRFIRFSNNLFYITKEEFFDAFSHHRQAIVNTVTRSQAKRTAQPISSTPAATKDFINNEPDTLNTVTQDNNSLSPNTAADTQQPIIEQRTTKPNKVNHNKENEIKTKSVTFDASNEEIEVPQLDRNSQSGKSTRPASGIASSDSANPSPNSIIQPKLRGSSTQNSTNSTYDPAAAAVPGNPHHSTQQSDSAAAPEIILAQAPIEDDSPEDNAITSIESEGASPEPEPEPPPGYVTKGTAAGYAKASINKAMLKLAPKVYQLHLALGCLPYSQIAAMVGQGKLIDEALTPKLVMYIAENVLGPCDHCTAGKAKQPAQYKRQYDRVIDQIASGIRNLCIDIMFTKSASKKHHPVLVAVLELYNFINLTYLESKSTKDVQAGLNKLITFFEKYGQHIDFIRCDREAAFVELSTKQYKMELTGGPGYHEAVIEAIINSIQRIVLCILHRLIFDLPRSLFPRLVEHAAVTHNNRLQRGATQTPQEAVMGIKPTPEQLIAGRFGRIAYFTIPTEDLKRHHKTSFGEEPTEVGIVMGYESRSPHNLKVLLVDNMEIVQRRGGKDVTDQSVLKSVIEKLNKVSAEEETKFKAMAKSKGKKSTEDSELRNVIADNNIEMNSISEVNVVSSTHSITTAVGNRQHIPGTRPIVIDGHIYILPPNAFERISIRKLAQFLPQQLIDKAVVDELVGNMEGKGVWKYVTWDNVRKEKAHVIRSMFFLKVKEKDGLFDKLKGRLVCDGSSQQDAQFGHTYSPTVNKDIIFLVLSLVKYLQAKIATVDVPAAFLNSKLKEKIYMFLDTDIAKVLVKQNPELAKYQNEKGQLVVLLLMCLYGLKQAGAEWYSVLSTFIVKELGYNQSIADRCLFFKVVDGQLHIIVVHVDDLLITYTHEGDYQMVKRKLSAMFGEMKFIEGPKHTYLGLEITVLRDKSVFLSQGTYLQKVINSYNDWRVTIDPKFSLKPYVTPSVSTLISELVIVENCEDAFQQSVIHYVYSLSYVSQRTRPDIMFTVNIMATVVSGPPRSIIRHLDRVFGYLSATVKKGILLGANNTSLSMMADSAYGIHIDGKSHTGILVYLDTSIISVKSKKQKLVTVSSTEAEMESMTEALKEKQPIHKLLEELNLLMKQPTIVYQDNKSTMRLAKRGEGFDGKSRHMRVRYHYIAEQIAKGEIDIRYLETTKMVADLLTKPGGGSNFAELVSAIVKDMPTPDI